MRRALVGLVVVGIVIAARHHAAPANKGAVAAAILKDVADTSGRDVSWRVGSSGNHATVWQHDQVALTGDAANAHVVGDSWKLDLALFDVAVIRCSITGGDVGDTPEYGFISFEPEHSDGTFDARFSIGFPEPSIGVLERVCAKHGLPVER